MNLGISGKKALVCASSKGLGKGCAMALAEAGVDLILNARGQEALDSTAMLIRSRYNVNVEAVPADITSAEGQNEVLERAGAVDILVNNAGGPPPGVWSEWAREDFLLALNANMLTPIALMSHIIPIMIEKGWGRVVNITSQSVKAPIAALGLSNAARGGLTGYVAGTSRQVAPYGVTINNLLPGVHNTDRIVSLDTEVSQSQGVPLEEVTKDRAASVPVGRYGTIEEFGATCAFMCSQQASFMVGQNILLDGGAVNATI